MSYRTVLGGTWFSIPNSAAAWISGRRPAMTSRVIAFLAFERCVRISPASRSPPFAGAMALAAIVFGLGTTANTPRAAIVKAETFQIVDRDFMIGVPPQVNRPFHKPHSTERTN